MVYLVADNDLDYYGPIDVDEMKTVGSTASVNIVVLWDSWDGPAQVYKVNKVGLEELTDSELNGKEVNMGASETLRDFVGYATKKFRTDHYVLVLWDHGDDFGGCCWDYHTVDQEESIDYLNHQEITSALSRFRLDILAYDGCVMSLIEVPYEYYVQGLKIDYFVGSEGYVPMEGFPYDTILANLTANPAMSPSEFSKVMVDKYEEFYQPHGGSDLPGGYLTALSAIDMNKMGDVNDGTKALIETLTANIDTYHKVVGSARGQSNLPWSEYGWEALVDYVTFVNRIWEKAPDETIEELSASLLESLSDAIYVKNTGAMTSMDAGGLAVFFPSSHGSFVHNYGWNAELYGNMQFASEVWLNFLYAYYKV
jgi:hypothetical protein